MKILKDAFLGQIIGVSLVFIAGVVAGVISRGSPFVARGYFDDLMNLFSFVFYLGPTLLIFFIVGRSLNDKTIALYPLVGWYMGERIEVFISPFVEFILGSIPGVVFADNVKIAVTLGCIYVITYLVLRPVHFLSKAVKQPQARKQSYTKAYAILLIFNIIVIAACVVFGQHLYTELQRNRAAIRIPSTVDVIGSPPYSSNQETQTFSVAYAEPTEQKNGTYQFSHKIKATPLQEWWIDDARVACGKAARLSYTNKSVPYSYAATPGGIQYATASSEENRSSSESPESAYTLTRYCWAVDGKKYTTDIEDTYGLSFLSKYPIEKTIDIVASSQKFIPSCYATKISFAASDKPAYCEGSDDSAGKKLAQDWNDGYVVPYRQQITKD
ncbi:hypothetical protein EOL71_02905 [Candidatus Saccharibacteria bacterium]|nr:hypothetical protein [Candidatus Saccharibacteria bacterium]